MRKRIWKKIRNLYTLVHSQQRERKCSIRDEIAQNNHFVGVVQKGRPWENPIKLINWINLFK